MKKNSKNKPLESKLQVLTPEPYIIEVRIRKEPMIMLEKMREYISEQLNVDPEEIQMDTNFRDDLGADSLDLYELAMNLEDEYQLEIPVEELQEL